jgi:hypothetical protein
MAKHCGGKTSFNSMKEYASRWNFAMPIKTPSSDSDIITLDHLRNEGANHPDAVAAAAEALVMLRACKASDHPELIIHVAGKSDDSLLYIEEYESHFLCQHLPTPDGKFLAHKIIFKNTSLTRTFLALHRQSSEWSIIQAWVQLQVLFCNNASLRAKPS